MQDFIKKAARLGGRTVVVFGLASLAGYAVLSLVTNDRSSIDTMQRPKR